MKYLGSLPQQGISAGLAMILFTKASLTQLTLGFVSNLTYSLTFDLNDLSHISHIHSFSFAKHFQLHSKHFNKSSDSL